MMAPAELGLWVLEQTRGDYVGSDLNGGDIQDKAEELGLLVRVDVTEPCCEEHCHCAEYGEFPQQCLRYSDAVAEAQSDNQDRGKPVGA